MICIISQNLDTTNHKSSSRTRRFSCCSCVLVLHVKTHLVGLFSPVKKTRVISVLYFGYKKTSFQTYFLLYWIVFIDLNFPHFFCSALACQNCGKFKFSNSWFMKINIAISYIFCQSGKLIQMHEQFLKKIAKNSVKTCNQRIFSHVDFFHWKTFWKNSFLPCISQATLETEESTSALFISLPLVFRVLLMGKLSKDRPASCHA